MTTLGKLIAVVGAVASLAGIFLCIFFMLPYIYDFRLTSAAVEVVLFRSIAIYKIPFGDIRSVRAVNAFSVSGVAVNPFRAIRIGNRFTSKAILIEKRGMLTFVLITPKDPGGFCDELLIRLGEGAPVNPSSGSK
ncbi:hypothetical protein [Bradyrhizobium sp. WD16]|uniref:hypothetical protein n=1 Tax=Bradyrhizobium sp. WD16 TaxID=1521768 RepID=UPI0020A389E4|nr:hypothetical protein [Bradyrhizobium sp. WD16]UTD26539.1 hypothetical protein DB459_05990 [Bradyrhizobium sp. WD16]